MAEYKLTIENHPAQKRDPYTNEPLSKNGVPVPLWPDEHCIKLNGKQIIAFLNAEHRITFIISEQELGAALVNEAEALRDATFGDSPASIAVPNVPKKKAN
jgi:hypothetical protein